MRGGKQNLLNLGAATENLRHLLFHFSIISVIIYLRNICAIRAYIAYAGIYSVRGSKLSRISGGEFFLP